MQSYLLGAIIASTLLGIFVFGICAWAFAQCRKDREKLRIFFIVAFPLLALVLLIGYVNICNAHSITKSGGVVQITGACLEVEPIVRLARVALLCRMATS